MKYIHTRRASRLVREAKETGLIFSVTFTMRTTGKRRRMLCRGRVQTRASVNGRPYDPSEYKLSTVFDVQKYGYRTIPLDAILRIKAQGEIYVP